MQELSQDLFATQSSPPQVVKGRAGSFARRPLEQAAVWMVADVMTILGAAALATLYELHIGPVAGAKGFWRGTLIHGHSRGTLLALLCGFCIALILTSRRLNLYAPKRLNSFLHEQRLSVQANLSSGLLLAGALYLLHATDISRRIVLMTVGLVTILLSLRRLIYRLLLHRNFMRGIGNRNVLIVGTGQDAQTLRHTFEKFQYLGYTFKGFISLPGADCRVPAVSRDVIGSLDAVFQHAYRGFVDEIFVTAPCQREIIKQIIEEARYYGVDLRFVPDMQGGLLWNNPIEHIGQFLTIPLHCSELPEGRLLLKRSLDIVVSALALLVLSPLYMAIAIAVKLDSSGPVFYLSERIGKKGRVFRCTKFRTMTPDADERRAGLLLMNERDGVLFKIANDPRITKLGRFLRKYSLDELPQFYNVLRGDMSVVGPRPPLAGEVREYELSHLRRLDVTPGITGLWQVQARKDPSFDNYISCDIAYINSWSIWLDLKIIVRTIGVVFAGTGS
jgi:exopolysaccharide biosynthesis polyprenyl glycosylphosphotransferase